MPKFIKGMELSESFFSEVVEGLLSQSYPRLKYSAGLIGSGSEVLGFDTEQSSDHHWGPRVMVFLNEEDIANKHKLSEFLSKNLPPKFKGFPTNFGSPDNIGVQLMVETEEGDLINHRVEILNFKAYIQDYLGYNIYEELSSIDWLTLSEHKLRTIKDGRLFRDDLGVGRVKEKLEYYPKDIWLYLMASEWTKIAQEEPFVGRCIDLNDRIGAGVIISKLLSSVIKLCFLMEKEYIPYGKWFGTAFRKLNCSKNCIYLCEKVLLSESIEVKEDALLSLYKIIAEMHNKLGVTSHLSSEIRIFHERPYRVIEGERFADALIEQIKSSEVLKLKQKIGSVNQITDSVDILGNNELLKRMGDLY